MTDTPRVVFDCNVFLQALASPDGPAGACFNLAVTGRCRLFVSPTVLAELREVTSRPKLIAKLGLNPTRVDEFVEAIVVVATIVKRVAESFTFARDPDDAHYVNLALKAEAQLIVSRDRDLLDLMRGSTPEGTALLKKYPGFRILTPPDFLDFMDAHAAGRSRDIE